MCLLDVFSLLPVLWFYYLPILKPHQVKKLLSDSGLFQVIKKTALLLGADTMKGVDGFGIENNAINTYALKYMPLISRPSVFWEQMCFCVWAQLSVKSSLWPSWCWQIKCFWLLSTCTLCHMRLGPEYKSCQLLVKVTRSEVFFYL